MQSQQKLQFPPHSDWCDILASHLESPSFQNLLFFLAQEEGTVYPPQQDIFSAFLHTPFHQVKVVIVGQDPYHGQGQANGLAFSVQPSEKIPPSLRNIYKELVEDNAMNPPIHPPIHGDLSAWATQGVLLLNTCLTVRANQPNSHRGKGWEAFTDHVISQVNKKDSPVVFLLWGNHAKEKRSLVTNPKHLILQASHPSPFSASRGFLGCGHFSKTNLFLQEQGLSPIDWQV